MAIKDIKQKMAELEKKDATEKPKVVKTDGVESSKEVEMISKTDVDKLIAAAVKAAVKLNETSVDIADEETEYSKAISGRGFKCETDITAFIDSKYYKGLQEAEHVEFSAWLNNVDKLK